jgi:hypothetical protein
LPDWFGVSAAAAVARRDWSGFVNAPDAHALAADDAAVDAVMRSRFHIEPPPDPSGLLGAPTLASEDEIWTASRSVVNRA